MRTLDGRIDLFSRCNYRCVYCQNDTSEHHTPPWFKLNDLEKVLPVIAKNCWAVYLSCGGEPLLHPEFANAMQIVKKHLKSNDVFLVTNGSHLDKMHRDALLESSVTRIQVSIHTLDPDLYSRLYGCPKDALQKVLTNVSSFIKERGTRKYPRLMITSIAMKSTLHGLTDLAQWVVSNNIDGIAVQWLIPFDTPVMEEEVITSRAQCTPVFTNMEQLLKKTGKNFEWPSSFTSKKLFHTIRDALNHKNPVEYLYFNLTKTIASIRKRRCHIAGNYFWLENDGSIRICHRDALNLDNFFDGETHTILRKVKTSKNSVRFSEPPCIDCPYLKS